MRRNQAMGASAVLLGLVLVVGWPPTAAPSAGHPPCRPGTGHEKVLGQTIYVPAYAEIPHLDETRRYQLAVTLSIRNPDMAQPMHVLSVRYFDAEGRLIRAYVEHPLRLGPLTATTFVVAERDTRGGAGASFLVEWRAEVPVSAPVVEAVMIGTAGQQGISFVSPGRVLRTQCP